MPFTFKRLDIPDVILVESKSFKDNRGFFLETFKESPFLSEGIDTKFVQDNLSYSINGVLRGLHYQTLPKAQAKLVTVIKGKIFDVMLAGYLLNPAQGSYSVENLAWVYLKDSNGRQAQGAKAAGVLLDLYPLLLREFFMCWLYLLTFPF